MTPTDASLLTAEHLRTLADRLDRGEVSGVSTVRLDGTSAKWSHYTLPSQALTMLGATQSCQLALVARLMGFEARNIGDVA
jgi:hypothetical protein